MRAQGDEFGMKSANLCAEMVLARVLGISPYSLNLVEFLFYEVRLPMAKATVQTSKQKTKQKN
jgi:hypothetical protein